MIFVDKYRKVYSEEEMLELDPIEVEELELHVIE